MELARGREREPPPPPSAWPPPPSGQMGGAVLRSRLRAATVAARKMPKKKKQKKKQKKKEKKKKLELDIPGVEMPALWAADDPDKDWMAGHVLLDKVTEDKGGDGEERYKTDDANIAEWLLRMRVLRPLPAGDLWDNYVAEYTALREAQNAADSNFVLDPIMSLADAPYEQIGAVAFRSRAAFGVAHEGGIHRPVVRSLLDAVNEKYNSPTGEAVAGDERDPNTYNGVRLASLDNWDTVTGEYSTTSGAVILPQKSWIDATDPDDRRMLYTDQFRLLDGGIRESFSFNPVPRPETSTFNANVATLRSFFQFDTDAPPVAPTIFGEEDTANYDYLRLGNRKIGATITNATQYGDFSHAIGTGYIRDPMECSFRAADANMRPFGRGYYRPVSYHESGGTLRSTKFAAIADRMNYGVLAMAEGILAADHACVYALTDHDMTPVPVRSGGARAGFILRGTKNPATGAGKKQIRFYLTISGVRADGSAAYTTIPISFPVPPRDMTAVSRTHATALAMMLYRFCIGADRYTAAFPDADQDHGGGTWERSLTRPWSDDGGSDPYTYWAGAAAAADVTTTLNPLMFTLTHRRRAPLDDKRITEEAELRRLIARRATLMRTGRYKKTPAGRAVKEAIVAAREALKSSTEDWKRRRAEWRERRGRGGSSDDESGHHSEEEEEAEEEAAPAEIRHAGGRAVKIFGGALQVVDAGRRVVGRGIGGADCGLACVRSALQWKFEEVLADIYGRMSVRAPFTAALQRHNFTGPAKDAISNSAPGGAGSAPSELAALLAEFGVRLVVVEECAWTRTCRQRVAGASVWTGAPEYTVATNVFDPGTQDFCARDEATNWGLVRITLCANDIDDLCCAPPGRETPDYISLALYDGHYYVLDDQRSGTIKMESCARTGQPGPTVTPAAALSFLLRNRGEGAAAAAADGGEAEMWTEFNKRRRQSRAASEQRILYYDVETYVGADSALHVWSVAFASTPFTYDGLKPASEGGALPLTLEQCRIITGEGCLAAMLREVVIDSPPEVGWTLVAYNGAVFDVRFLIDALEAAGMTVSSLLLASGRILSLRFGVEGAVQHSVWDPARYTSMSLDAACKSFAVSDAFKKLPGEINHHEVQAAADLGRLGEWVEANREKVERYNKRDVTALAAVVHNMRVAVLRLGTDIMERVTVGGCVYEGWCADVVARYGGLMGRKKKKKKKAGGGPPAAGIWTPKSESEDALIRATLVGGRTEVLAARERLESAEFTGALSCLDFRSMYPYVMLAPGNLYPRDAPQDFVWDGARDGAGADTRFIDYYERVLIIGQPAFVIYPRRVPGTPLDWKFRGRHTNTVSMNSIDLAGLREAGGEAEIEEGSRVLRFTRAFEGAELFAVLSEWYKLKTEQDALKNAGDPAYNPAFRQIVKLWLNNLWGKFAQRNFNKDQLGVIHTEEEADKFEASHTDTEFIPAKEDWCIARGDSEWDPESARPIQLASLVVAYARRHLVAAIRAVATMAAPGESLRPLYCDTDSIVAPLVLAERLRVARPDMFTAEIGGLEEEWHNKSAPAPAAERGIFISPKLYCLWSADGRFKGRIKGVRPWYKGVPYRECNAAGEWLEYCDRVVPAAAARRLADCDTLAEKKSLYLRTPPLHDGNMLAAIFEPLLRGERVELMRGLIRKTGTSTNASMAQVLSVYQAYHYLKLTPPALRADGGAEEEGEEAEAEAETEYNVRVRELVEGAFWVAGAAVPEDWEDAEAETAEEWECYFEASSSMDVGVMAPTPPPTGTEPVALSAPP